MNAPFFHHLSFERQGAQLIRGAATRDLRALEAIAAGYAPNLPGARLFDQPALAALLVPDSAIGSIPAGILGHGARPVRATLFNKTAGVNWSLGWHQDRAICVRQRIEAPGYGAWTVKAGVHHVEPPFEILRRMVTIRIHLDDVDDDNAPLLIAPGSHRTRVTVDAVPGLVHDTGVFACLAQAGDIWIHATTLLHASKPAAKPARRRVFQIDFSADDLPAGLEWLGI